MAGGKSFSFAEIIPETLTFRDDRFGGDGRAHDVLTGEMLSIAGVVELARAEKNLQVALAGAADPSPEDVGAVEGLVERMIALLIPSLPAERQAAIPFAYKMRFLEWWKEQQPEPTQGEVEAGRRLTRQRPSPASSASTG